MASRGAGRQMWDIQLDLSVDGCWIDVIFMYMALRVWFGFKSSSLWIDSDRRQFVCHSSPSNHESPPRPLCLYWPWPLVYTSKGVSPIYDTEEECERRTIHPAIWRRPAAPILQTPYSHWWHPWRRLQSIGSCVECTIAAPSWR
jgi:hypothetical protein